MAPELPITTTLRFLQQLPASHKSYQWGFQLDQSSCYGDQETPLELIPFQCIRSRLTHMCYMKADPNLSSILSQWAKVMYVYQLVGMSVYLVITVQVFANHISSHRQGMILPKQWFTRHMVHIRMITRTNQVLLFAAFKHHVQVL